MNALKTTALMALMTVLLVFIGSVIGGRTGAIFAFVVAAAMNFVAYWSSDKIALARYKAQEITREQAPKLYGIVETLVARAGLPMPREYIADAAGARFAGNSDGLASALMKLDDFASRRPMNASQTTAHMFIVNPLRGGGIGKLFSTHPPTKERVRKLRELRIG
jgi:Zn-dependent protease with chaperone function